MCIMGGKYVMKVQTTWSFQIFIFESVTPGALVPLSKRLRPCVPRVVARLKIGVAILLRFRCGMGGFDFQKLWGSVWTKNGGQDTRCPHNMGY